jgi:ketosteroid isomerase-like protein
MLVAVVFLLAMSARVFVGRTLADEASIDRTATQRTPAIQTPADETLGDETSGDETLAVEHTLDQFYTSLNGVLAGDAGGMDDVWSHDDSVTYMGPIGGIEIGWDQVRQGWNVQAEMKLGGHVEPTDLHVTVGNDLAIVEGYELGSIQDCEGRSRPFRIRSTSALRKENGRWKMILHHADLIEPLDRSAGNSSDSRASAGTSSPTEAAPDDDSIDVSDDEVILKLER